MANDGQIVFEVTADGKHAIADIKAITKAIQQETGKWDDAAKQSASGIENKFSGMLKKLAAGFSAVKIGQALLNLGKDALEAASDLQEVQNVVDVTFGDNANQIEKWAKNAGTQFGLTETQAKKFSSTMGAMLKSSGLAGEQIVDVSTDLAGLAADMASFYNLDFEEAFSKIRSGISGQTMPLKELGIDMSVATLNAFALQKGLTKTFDQMSQGEQTMLRYQYLMTATADAQGDFSRTSDGYANAMRKLQTNVESLKTTLGTSFINIVADATGYLNSFIELLLPDESKKTVLDDFKEIDLDTDKKLAEIRQVADEARDLTGVLSAIGADQAGEALKSMAEGANKLDASSPATWRKIYVALKDVDGLDNVFSSDNWAGKNITELANALSGSDVDTSKAEAWKKFLGALSENADAVSKLTGKSVEETQAWLEGISSEVDKIDPEDVTAWDDLLNTLVEGLSVTEDGKAFAESVGILATNAGKLDSSSPKTWNALLTALKDIDGLSNIFTNDKAGDNIEDLAQALSGTSVDTNKADAWKKFLGALSDNADAVSKLTGSSVEETKAWLDGLSESINGIDPTDADAWNTLLTTLAKGLSGDTPEGQKFLEALSTNLLALGNDSDSAVKGLEALGFSSDQITDKQNAWLATCKRLVKTIPGLNEIINTETGEVKGGVSAINDYVNAWEEGQRKLALLNAFEKKKAAYSQRYDDLYNYELDMRTAQYRVKKQAEELRKLYKRYGIREDLLPLGSHATDGGYYKNLPQDAQRAINAAADEYKRLAKAEKEATDQYNLQADAIKEVESELAEMGEAVADYVGDVKDATESTEDWLNRIGKTEDEIKALVDTAKTALDELDNHIQSVKESVSNSVGSTVKGFEYIGDADQRLAARLKPLQEEFEKLKTSGEDTAGISKRIADESDVYTITKMTNALQSQVKFLEEYKKDMEAAQKMGFSNEFLDQFTDGSVESAEWLHELVKNGSSKDVEKLNKLFSEVTGKKSELTETLTNQKLTVDDVYKNLADKAKEAVAALDLEGDAATNSGKTIEGMAKGITDHLPDVQEAVDSILAELNRLNGYGINIDFGGFGNITFTTSTGKTEGSGRFGLDYVPHDDYIARLHEGERVLTAQENQIWNALRGGGVAGFDLDALGGVMRDNVKPGGNVYLDGKIVGSVVSERQGRSYKSLTRSGWQS